jgi:hypothetical protein
VRVRAPDDCHLGRGLVSQVVHERALARYEARILDATHRSADVGRAVARRPRMGRWHAVHDTAARQRGIVLRMVG